MPWEVGDIVELKIFQNYLEQEVLNVIHYEIITSNPIADWEAGLDSIAEVLVDAFVVNQNALLSHVLQQWNNLTDGITYHDTVYQAVGARSGEQSISSFTAVGMKKTVGSRITRPGSIRVAGLDEGQVNGNDLESAAQIAFAVLGVQLALDRGFDDGAPPNEGEMIPVIVGRTLGAYDLTKINPIIDYGPGVLTTQNTRKSTS